MAINKVVFGNEIQMDLTEDTATEDKVLEGETFHDRSGNSRVGSLVIPVQDVEVNGESVVDPTTKIAEITSYKEVTQANYDNLPSSKESDNALYMVYSDGQILDPDYSYHKYGNNDEIIVRVYHEGQSDQQTLWFFRGWNQSSGIMDIPSSLITYAPSDTSQPVASISFTDNTGATQNGWIGFYSNNIRVWSQDWALYITGIMYGVVDPEGTGYPNPQTNPYVDDPYIYMSLTLRYILHGEYISMGENMPSLIFRQPTFKQRWMSLRHTMAVFYPHAKSPSHLTKIYTDMILRG